MINTRFFVLAALPLQLAPGAVSYQTHNQYPTEVALGSAPVDGTATFLDASNNPNASNSVSFAHFASSGGASDGVVSQNWTWTVKVSDVLMPNASSTNDSNLPAVPDAHVAYTTYDFSWPESGDLDSAISAEANVTGAAVRSCAWIITGLFPKKVSQNWDSSSPDCTSALGADCVQSLQKLISTASGTSCQSLSIDPSDPDFTKACASSFAAINSMEEGEGFWPKDFGNATASSASALPKGEVFSYSLSQPYPPDNVTVFDSEADNLHVLVLTGETTNVLCNRASNKNESTQTGSASRSADVQLTLIAFVSMACVVLSYW